MKGEGDERGVEVGGMEEVEMGKREGWGRKCERRCTVVRIRMTENRVT